MMLAAAGALVVATFVSEDLACIAAGVLIARGDLPAAVAVTACVFGIFLGDCGLWMAGRLASGTASRWSWLARRLPRMKIEQCRRWLDQHAGYAIVASRFTPGTRLPLYVTAGIVRMSPVRFGLWTLGAAAVWTPAVVIASARTGEAAGGAAPWAAWPVVAVGASVLVISRATRLLLSSEARATVAARVGRWTRWEFWPAWLFYAPVACWVAILSIRHRGLATMTASNPGIPDGGVAGESKFEILRNLPADSTIPSVRLSANDCRLIGSHAIEEMARCGWAFPIVLKPDVGQRGMGVRLVRSLAQLREYLAIASSDVLMQPYHEGPYEAGIFYYRFPGEPRGRIFSITDKRFPGIVGDGRSTVAALIAAHPRYRFQAALFLNRHWRFADTILASGERLQLAIAGNHAQGTMFLDGGHLVTPELERRIDDIAQQYHGFYIGRFDVRYRDVEAFKTGRDLAIVELNGATAESTNIYDPAASLFAAYRTLFRQWSLVFAIGSANRARGAVPTSTRRLVHLAVAHLTATPRFPLSN